MYFSSVTKSSRTQTSSQENRKSDCFVLGVYDPWTGLDDVDFKAAQNPNFGGRYSFVGKDTDMLTVMKLYTVADFINKVENPDMYNDVDQGGDPANTRVESFYGSAYYVDLTAEESTSVTNKTEISNDNVVSEFTISPDNDYRYMVRIPEIVFTAETSDRAYLDAAVRFRLVNEDNNLVRYLDWFEPDPVVVEDDFAHYSNLTGLKTFRTTSNDITTDDLGYGRYTLYFDFDITLHGTSNYDTDSRIEFNGGSIYIIKTRNG